MKVRLFIILVLSLCSSLQSLDANTILVFRKDTQISGNCYFYSGSQGLQTDEIKTNWDNNKRINAVAYTNNGWFVAMSWGMGYTMQTYNNIASWPDSWIKEKFSDGYFITQLSASPYLWMIVMSQKSGYTQQPICGAPWTELAKWISNHWNQGYYITSTACRDGIWTVVMSKGTSYTQQCYFFANSYSDLTSQVKAKWDEGYRIRTLDSYDGQYFCVMVKFSGSDSVAESYSVDASDPQTTIKNKWDEGYNLIYIGQ